MPSPNLAELAFAIQTAKGSIAASSTRRIYLSGGTLPTAQKLVQGDGSNSVTRIDRDPVVPSVPVSGTPEAIIRPGMIGALLYAVLGSKAVSGASDPWTHTFTLGTATPYLTFWRYYAGIFNERIADARISRLTISGRSGDALRVSFEVASGVSASRTTQETTVAVETADFLLMEHGHGALKIEGVAVTSITNFTLTIDPAIELVETLAGPVPFLSGRGAVRVTVDQALIDATLWNRMMYASSAPANLTAPVLTPLELAGAPAGIEFMFTEQAAPERSLKLAIPRVAVAAIDGLQPATTYGQARMQGTFEAFAPAGGVSPITATLKNSVSSY